MEVGPEPPDGGQLAQEAGPKFHPPPSTLHAMEFKQSCTLRSPPPTLHPAPSNSHPFQCLLHRPCHPGVSAPSPTMWWWVGRWGGEHGGMVAWYEGGGGLPHHRLASWYLAWLLQLEHMAIPECVQPRYRVRPVGRDAAPHRRADLGPLDDERCEG